tara:strand:+ start:595 stop:1056 length:462 start_codon:yes stop_codon:yes gene_type:complete
MVAGKLYLKKRTILGRPRVLTDEQRKLNIKNRSRISHHNTCITIYCIQSPNLPNTIYIGKTKLKLIVRFRQHKHHTNTCSSKEIINAGNADIDILDTCPLDFTKDDLLQIETDWILRYREMGFNVVNKNTISTPEKHKQQMRNWYLNNRRTQE